MKSYKERLPLIDADALRDFNNQDCWWHKEGNKFLWLVDGEYQRLDSPYGYCGEYICTRDEFEQRKAELSTKEQDMNDWYEKGELPPVGTECEYIIGERRGYYECTFVGLNSRGSIVIEDYNGEYKAYHSHQIEFRPLRTEHDVLVEKCTAILEKGVGNCEPDKYLAQQVVDAGWRPVKQQTEDEFAAQAQELTDYVSIYQLSKLYRAGCRFIEQVKV